MAPCEQCIILQEFWDGDDEQFKTNMLILFLLNYNITTTTPYDYITLFTDENLRNFILDF